MSARIQLKHGFAAPADRPVHVRIDDLGSAQILLRTDQGELDLSDIIGDGLFVRVRRGDVSVLELVVPLMAVHIDQVERVR